MNHRCFGKKVLLPTAFALALAMGVGACANGDDVEWQGVQTLQGFENRTVERPESPQWQRRDRTESESAAIFVGGFVLAAVGGMLAIAIGFALFHRRRSLIEKSFNPTAPLRDGEGVVFGKVETEDRQPGIIIRVEQVGKEWCHKGAWNHSWTEVNRQKLVRPFFIRTPNGQLVRIEPEQNVKVHDEFSRTDRGSLTQRVRTAELTHGEEVHVFGTVTGAGTAATQGAYRDSGQTPVVRAPRIGAMQISSEKPGETANKRSKFYRGWAIGLLLWMLFALTIMHGNYVTLMLTGDVVMATPNATKVWREWVKPKNQPGYWRYHYMVRASAEGNILEEEVSQSLYNQVSAGEYGKLPFLVSSVRPSVYQFGTEPLTSDGAGFVGALVAIVLGLAFPLFARSSRPWYDQKRFNEGGGGRL